MPETPQDDRRIYDWLHDGFNRLEGKVDKQASQTGALASEVRGLAAKVDIAASPRREPCVEFVEFRNAFLEGQKTTASRVWTVGLRLLVYAIIAGATLLASHFVTL